MLMLVTPAREHRKDRAALSALVLRHGAPNQRSRYATLGAVSCARRMATSKKSAKAKPAPLPTPPRVQSIWEEIKNKTALQLFHPSPEKRIEAVAALKDKFMYYEKRGTLLLAAALDDPDTAVRTAMLEAVAHTGSYMAWSEARRLREHAKAFVAVDDPGLHLALAKCFAEIPVPLVDSDLPWIMALVDGPAGQDANAFSVVVRLITRAIRTGVAQREALAAYERLLRHPAHGGRALWLFSELNEHRATLVPVLIELCAQGGEIGSAAVTALAFVGPTQHDSRAISTLEALRDADLERAWAIELYIGLLDRASLPARIEKHRQRIDAELAKYRCHGLIIEALSFCPEKARDWVEVSAASVLENVAYASKDTMQRWVRGNPALVASAVEPRLFESYSGIYYMPWWEQLRPETAAADAIRGIEKMLAECPRGNLEYRQQRYCEECCALIERVGRAPDGALAVLAKLGARQVPHLVSSVIPTARAMHKLGARESDFAPIVAAYDKEAIAFEKRASKDPAYDPATGWGAKLRWVATALSAMGTYETVRANWSVFTSIFAYDFGLEKQSVMTMLAPYLDHPEVKELFERALTDRWAPVQRQAAAALGLLVQ